MFSGRLSDASVCLLEFWGRVCGALLLQPPRVRRGPTRSVANPIASPSSSSTLLELSASPLRVQATMRKIGFLQARRQAPGPAGMGWRSISSFREMSGLDPPLCQVVVMRRCTFKASGARSCAGAHLRCQGDAGLPPSRGYIVTETKPTRERLPSCV